MKKFNYFFLLLALLIGANFFVSCSNDTSVVANEEASTDVTAFLKSYYGADVRLGRSVKVKTALPTSRSASGANYTVTEVFVGSEPRARGYNFTDNASRKLVCFFDIDRTNFVVTTVDITTNVTQRYSDINQLTDYYPTDEFDFIKIYLDPTHVDPPQNQVLGWHYSYGAPYTYNGKCYQGVYRAWYGAGIRLTKWNPVQDDNGTNVAVPCGTEYSPR